MSKPRSVPKAAPLEAQERSIFVERTRASARHYLSHEVAALAGMSMPQLQQFSMGWFTPSDAQIDILAGRMSLI